MPEMIAQPNVSKNAAAIAPPKAFFTPGLNAPSLISNTAYIINPMTNSQAAYIA